MNYQTTNASTKAARSGSYKSNQHSQMQMSHPSLVTFNQIETAMPNYNSSQPGGIVHTQSGSTSVGGAS